MKKFLLLSALFLIPTACLSSGTRADYFAETPDDAHQERVWMEEVRTPDGAVVGYLEKIEYRAPNTRGIRDVYYVYDRFLGGQPRGQITENGWAYRFDRSRGESIELGPTGIERGVQRILDHHDPLEFYRHGERIRR